MQAFYQLSPQLQTGVITAFVTVAVTLITITVTASVALVQLRHDRQQRAADRRLETKRALLLDGVKAMQQAQAAYVSLLAHPNNLAESGQMFRDATARITTASCVASMKAVRCGREFINVLGPLFYEAIFESVRLNELSKERNSNYEALRIDFAVTIMSNVPKIGEAMYSAIAAVRADMDVSAETDAEFIEAIRPDLSALDRAQTKFILEAKKWAGLANQD